MIPSLLMAVQWYAEPITYGIVLGAAALLLLLPRSTPVYRGIGGVLGAGAAGAFVAAAIRITHADPTHELIEWIVFAVLAATTVGSAVAMISSRSAVYSAIWFALTLLGTGGLFLYQGAAFLGVATVVVYAGAIVVTLLFVIMLSQPDGHAAYDRISWGWFAKPAATIVGALLLGSVVYALQGISTGGLRQQVALAVNQVAASDPDFLLRDEQVAKAVFVRAPGGRQLHLQLTSDASELKLTEVQQTALAAEITKQLAATAKVNEETKEKEPVEPFQVQLDPALTPSQDVLAQEHMAHLGGVLFSRYLLAVELGATLLLAAMVGAVAMLSQSAKARAEGEAHV